MPKERKKGKETKEKRKKKRRGKSEREAYVDENVMVAL